MRDLHLLVGFAPELSLGKQHANRDPGGGAILARRTAAVRYDRGVGETAGVPAAPVRFTGGFVMRAPFLALLFAAALAVVPAFAGHEVREIDPLSEKDLSMFEIEGGGDWKLDDESDLVHTFIVCPKAEDETSLRFRARRFRDGFQLKFDVMGGSKSKDLKCYLVPEKGERILVPWKSRYLRKKDWHSVTVTVENGKAQAKIDDEKGEKIDVGDVPLTFALNLPKRGEATIRKMEIKFLVINREQAEAEKGYVRIFDGKTLTGWVTRPEGSTFFKALDQRIEGSLPQNQEVPETALIFADAIFANFTLRMKVGSGARNLLLLGRFGIQGGARPTFTDIAGYLPGDKDWSDVLFEVKGKMVSLTVNGNRVWSQQAATEGELPIHIIMGRNGRCVLRDIQVKGDLTRYGASWPKYVEDSGGKVGSGEAEPGAGDAAGGGGNVTGGGRTFQMWNGKDLTDWRSTPAGSFSVAGDKIVALTYGKPSGAQLIYTKYWFQEYKVSFLLQKGSKNAAFIVKAFPREANKPAVLRKFEDAWFGEDRFTEFELTLLDGVLSVHTGGKKVKSMNVSKENGAIGFLVDKEGAIGVKDVWFNRKK
jgi:hypothetical protein